MPTSIEPRSKETVLFTASSPGHNLNGKVLTLRTSKGTLNTHDVTIQNGVAQTTLAAGSVNGNGLLTATLEDIVFAQQPFTVEYKTPLLMLSETVLVGDQASNGNVPIDDGNGDIFNAPYVVSTKLTLTGNVGDTEKVTIGSVAAPPIEPLLSYNLNHVYSDNRVGDFYGVINGEIENVIANTESIDGFKGSYSFNNNTKLTVPQHAALQKSNNIGFGLKIKPSVKGTIVDYTATSQQLKLLTNNHFQYQITTEDGTFVVESDAVALDNWHTVGVRYYNNELMLEVNGEKFTTSASGNLVTTTTGSTAIVIGQSFSGLLNDFKVTDWDYPLLATLPNGSFEMEVTFTSATETVVISSTNQLGTRPMGYLTAQNQSLFTQAYANNFFSSFIGEVVFQAQAVSYALVETGKWGIDTTKGFALGVITGDTSTTAGVIGDIVVGFIPFGDSRDIAIQEWFYAHETLNKDGTPKYDETILYLAYMGLGSDALMLSPAAPFGVTLNGIIAVIKPAMKLINAFPAKKVLGAKFKEIALAAKDRDWTRFENLSKGMLPFLELFATVAIDEDLRNLLASAIRNTTDLDNWTQYLKGYAAQAELTAHQSPLPEHLFDEAYAATSGFKLILKELLEYSTSKGIDDVGAVLSDSIGGLRKAIDNNSAIAAYAYKTEAIQAMMNIHKLEGHGAIEKLSKFKHISQGVKGGTVVADKRIEKMMKNFAELDLTLIPTGKNAGEGFSRILGDLSRSNSFAKGAAHAINVLKRIQKSEIDRLKDLGDLTQIEKTRKSIINGKPVRSGREDYIFGDTILELKSYNTENLRANLIRDMKGKKNGQQGLQMFTNVLEMVEGKDIRIVFEKFDGMDVASVRNTVDEVVTNALKNDKNLRAHISGWYRITSKRGLDKKVKKILSTFRNKLTNNILVVE